MNDEINSIIPEYQHDENQNEKKTSDEVEIDRRDFLKLAGAGAVAIASIATPPLIIQNTDNTFADHVQSGIEDAVRIASTEPAYLSTKEYSSFFQENQDSIKFSETEWVNVIGPGLDKFFNLYFGKSLAEGFQVLSQTVINMNVDPRHLQMSASYWGSEKIRTEKRVLIEDATNIAQTVISAGLDSNIIDKSLSTINPNLKPVQSIYSSSVLDSVASQNKRALGAKRLRSVGPNDSDARTYARSISAVAARENLPANYFGSRLFNGSQEVAELSHKLDIERSKGEPSKRTSDDFIQGSRILESQILKDQNDLSFGVKLFAAHTRYREYIILKNLGQNNFDNLNEEQQSIIDLMMLVSMDDYPNLPRKFDFDERFDGQLSWPEDIIPGFIADTKNIQVDENTEDIFDPNLWDPMIKDKVEYIRNLRTVSHTN